MARPKNRIVVLPDNTVISIAPSALRSYLEATSNGVSTAMGGKVLGTVDLTLAVVTQDNARAVLQSMFPETETPAPAPTVAAAPTVAPEATVSGTTTGTPEVTA